jgi:hypothetical protein
LRTHVKALLVQLFVGFDSPGQRQVDNAVGAEVAR